MFFRDYKSKIVKGIEEDDLLEGRKKEITYFGRGLMSCKSSEQFNSKY